MYRSIFLFTNEQISYAYCKYESTDEYLKGFWSYIMIQSTLRTHLHELVYLYHNPMKKLTKTSGM